METLISQYIITFGWALTGAVSMAFALSIVVKIFAMISPIDEWTEIKNGNMAVAVLVAAVIIGTAFVIGVVVMP